MLSLFAAKTNQEIKNLHQALDNIFEAQSNNAITNEPYARFILIALLLLKNLLVLQPRKITFLKNEYLRYLNNHILHLQYNLYRYTDLSFSRIERAKNADLLHKCIANIVPSSYFTKTDNTASLYDIIRLIPALNDYQLGKDCTSRAEESLFAC